MKLSQGDPHPASFHCCKALIFMTLQAPVALSSPSVNFTEPMVCVQLTAAGNMLEGFRRSQASALQAWCVARTRLG